MLIVFLYAHTGHFIAFQVSRFQHTRQIRNDIRGGALKNRRGESLRLSVEEYRALVWVGEDEFVYEGNRFDLISKQQSEAYVALYCFRDTGEATLITGMKKYMQGLLDLEGKSKKGETPVKISCKDVFNITDQYSLSGISCFPQAHPRPFYLFDIREGASEISAPPPRPFSFQS